MNNATGWHMSRSLLPIASRRSTILPFLYQTSTIRSSLAPTQRSLYVNGAKHAKNPQDAIPFEGEVGARGHNDQNRPAGDTWTGDHTFDPSTKGSTNRRLRDSTITASEKAVFERMFKELSDDESTKAVEEDDPLENTVEDAEALNKDVYSELNAIFDKAISQTDRGAQQSPRAGPERKAPTQISRNFMTALDAFGGPSSKARRVLIARGSEEERKIQVSVVEHSRKVMKKIIEARTDTEIWRVLENDVFILIGQQESQKKRLEVQNQAKKRKRGGSTSKADQEAEAAKEKKQSLRVKEKSFQQAEIEAVLSSNYGDYCLAAMRNLRRNYPASPYAMNLLPTVKGLGSISHVLAASVDLYNEVLFLLWSQYSDLHGMANLITEMGNQGIESNEITLRILRMAQAARSAAFREDKPMKLWWSLGPVDVGWSRVRRSASKVYFEILQGKARNAMEEDIANGRDVESEVQMEQGSRQEDLSEKELREKRAGAHKATIMDGGLYSHMGLA